MPQTLQTALEGLNDEIAFVAETSEIAELSAPTPRLKFMSPAEFKNANYSDRWIITNGRKLYLANEWMKWPRRRKVNRIVYEPGQPRITPSNDLNTWFPSPNAPIKGELSLWEKYLDHMFATDPTYRNWLLAWLAYPIQHPGSKLNTAVVFWSAQTGTGKSTLAYIMKEIYGQHNCSLLREADFDASFNGWAIGKQFVEVDEMPSGGTRARRRAELLKSLTTRTRIPVDLKYQNRYEIRDTINYYYTSNHLESLYLDSHDRRFFIHNVGDTKLSESFFRLELGPWLKAGGFSAIHHHLKNEVDLSLAIAGGNPLDPTDLRPFSPNAEAPRTRARQEVVQASYDDAEAWIEDLIDCPHNVLPEDRSDWTIWTAEELYRIFDGAFPKVRLGFTAFARKLAARGLQLNGGVQVRVRDRKLRLYGLAETDKSVSALRIREEYLRQRDESETE